MFTEYEKTSIQTKQNPINIFVRHFSFLSEKFFRLSDSCPATTKKISQRLQADGNNPALSPTLQLRKSHWGRGLNVKPPAISQHCGEYQKVITPHISPAIPPLSCRCVCVGGGAMDTNDWCITFTRAIGIVENLGLRPRFSTLPSGPCAMLTVKLNGKSCLIPLVIFGTPIHTLIDPRNSCYLHAKKSCF